MIFSAEDRVDLEKEQKIKDTANCQQNVADAILFRIYFISSKLVICFILVLFVIVVFTLVTVFVVCNETIKVKIIVYLGFTNTAWFIILLFVRYLITMHLCSTVILDILRVEITLLFMVYNMYF